MTIVELFSRSSDPASDPEESSLETVLTMFSVSECHFLGLLMNRKYADGSDVFKDVSLEANRSVASLAIRFCATEKPYMHVDKMRKVDNSGYTFMLRQENCAPVVCDDMRDIYEMARDRISMMLGESLYDDPKEEAADRRAVPHLRIVEL